MRNIALKCCALMLFTHFATAADTKTMVDEPQTKVKLQTTLGEIVIALDAKKAPISTDNFLTYVKDGFYDGTIFHRVMPGFMAQGGGFTTDFKQKATRDTIQNEADNGLKNDRGTVTMARTPDPHSASSQFFINYKDNEFLNYKSSTPQGWGYAVFGQVIEGMEVVDEMARQPTGSRGMHQDVPKTDIVITKAVVVSD